MTDSELARCSSLIESISHIGIPVEAKEGLSRKVYQSKRYHYLNGGSITMALKPPRTS